MFPKNVVLVSTMKYIDYSSLLLHIFTVSWNTLFIYFFLETHVSENYCFGCLYHQIYIILVTALTYIHCFMNSPFTFLAIPSNIFIPRHCSYIYSLVSLDYSFFFFSTFIGNFYLENTHTQACLSCVWCTLWAASVFNDHPRCEDGQGGYILWCNVVSGLIGATDVIVAASIPGVFVYLKWKRKKEKKILKRERSKTVQEREFEEHEKKLNKIDQIEDPDERKTKYEEIIHEREAKIRERMTGSDMMVNPSIEMAVRGGTRTGVDESSVAAATNDEIVLSVAATSKTREELE